MSPENKDQLLLEKSHHRMRSTSLLGRAESLRRPQGEALPGRTLLPSIAGARPYCCHSRVPAESPLGLTSYPHPTQPATRQRAGRAAGPVDCGLIFSGLLSPLTEHTQGPSGSDNHLEEASSGAFCKWRKSAFKVVERFS